MRKLFSDIREKANLRNEEYKKIQSSSAYRRVIGVLSGLGFLKAPAVEPIAMSKVTVEEALKIGLSIEPRVLEVLPAAIISFPKTFLHLEKAPPQLREVIEAINRGRTGPDFEGISFDKFLEAAKRPIKNKKRKTIEERRIAKTFRFTPKTINNLKKESARHGINYTSYIERLIEKESKASS